MREQRSRPDPCLCRDLRRQGRRAAEVSADKKPRGVQKFDVITGEEIKKCRRPRPLYQQRIVICSPKLARRTDLWIWRENNLDECPSGTGAPSFRSPRPTCERPLRRGHRRTARGRLCRRHGGEGMRRPARSTRPSCSAPTTRSSTTSRSRTCRTASHRSRGLVGADGPTHNGVFDIAFLRTLPNFVLAARRATRPTCAACSRWDCCHDGPLALRYPRANCTGLRAHPRQ